MTDDAERRRQLILVAVRSFDRRSTDRHYANCSKVLRTAMRRAGIWDDRMAAVCHGDPDVSDPTLTLWYATLIEMTKPVLGQPLLLEGSGNLIHPADAAFTGCHLTDAGRAAAADLLADHPEWRDEPPEST